MQRNTGVKAISREVFLARENAKARRWHDQMQIARLGADRTVAIFKCHIVRRLDFEANRPAMALPLMYFVLAHGAHHKQKGRPLGRPFQISSHKNQA